MTIQVELLNEKALALLRNLEQLKLVKLFLPKGKTNDSSLALPNGKKNKKERLENAIKPIRQDLTLNQLLEEQNFKGFDRKELDQLITDIDLQEPIDELLALLKP